MSLRSHFSIFLFFLLGAALVISLGCEVSDVNKQNSVSSGTTSGSGSSGGAAANVTVTAANNTIVSGGTTTITVIVTDTSGRRTDASIILTSSAKGTFNGTTNTTLNGNTLGGILIVNYTGSSTFIDDEITATVAGTNIKGSTIISINLGAHQVTPSIGSGSGHGTITPSTPQTVNHNSTVGFTVIADTGYTASVVGTCGGTLSGTTYITSQITSDCTVIANFN